MAAREFFTLPLIKTAHNHKVLNSVLKPDSRGMQLGHWPNRRAQLRSRHDFRRIPALRL